MKSNEIIDNIEKYIDTSIKPALMTAQTRFCDKIYYAIKEDLLNYNESKFRKELPHSVWVIMNIGTILGDNDENKKVGKALTDILLGKNELDEYKQPEFYFDGTNLTINQGMYTTFKLSDAFPDVVKRFQNSPKIQNLPENQKLSMAMGLALEEMIQRDIQFTNRIIERVKETDYITNAIAKNLDKTILKVRQEGIELAPGDFKMGVDNKLLGHIDIKYTKKGPDNPNRYLNMIHINTNNSSLPMTEIAKVIEGYTYHGGVRNLNNMVLLYMYPDDGYWATKVLNEVKKILIKDLKKEVEQGVDLSQKNIGYLNTVWYGKQ